MNDELAFAPFAKLDDEFWPSRPIRVREEDVIDIDIPEDLSAVWINQDRRNGTVQGGMGQIRGNLTERERSRQEDQLTGLYCLAGFSLYATGGLELFTCSRMIQEIAPCSSDEGEDVPGLKIDVKGQRVRDYHAYSSQHKDLIWEMATSYPLPVKPNEMHKDTNYIAAIYVEPGLWGNPNLCIKLLGSATYGEMLMEPKRFIYRYRYKGDANPPPRGSYLRHAANLTPMPTLESLLPRWRKEQEIFGRWMGLIEEPWQTALSYRSDGRKPTTSQLEWMKTEALRLRRAMGNALVEEQSVLLDFRCQEDQALLARLVEKRKEIDKRKGSGVGCSKSQ